ncbi:MAG: peptidoglycan DD-metalloendopeptidase family protein [Pseudomonadota bacterium]
MSLRGVAIVVCLALLLGACRSKAPAPIYDRTSNPYKRAAESTTRIARPPKYVVRRGDTLYAIAWRYGLDFRELARWNGIGDPFTIFVGETLDLEEPRRMPSVRGSEATAVAVPDRAPAPAPREPERTPPQTRSEPVTQAPAPTQRSTPAPAARPPAASRPAPTPPPAASGGEVRWRWPADGPVLSSFSASDANRKGIDIGGQGGDPVRAAAAGEVVYSGAGLVGYGELIIIKHDERYLSAYGHNRKRLVSEGDRVEAGAVIAEMGDTGADRPMLHFEIRDKGKPRDPMGYLPGR